MVNSLGVISKNNSLLKYVYSFAIVFLFFWGLFICLLYGRIGFMPLDQSIVFDGGWRILSGQVPFRDFNTPNSLVPIYIQAAFFKIFGVNWLAYCLHAAIFNGLFCIMVYAVLRLAGGVRWLSFFYAFLSGLVFYPPFGVPYMDQHAFFFIMLTLLIILKAYRSQALSSKIRCWIVVPLTMVLALLSKQIPSVFVLPFFGILLLMTTSKKNIMIMILACVVSLAVVLIILATVAAFCRMDFSQMKASMYDWPGKVGLDRFQSTFNKYTGWEVLKGLFYPLPSIPFSLRLLLFNLINLSAFFALGLALLNRFFKLLPHLVIPLQEILNNIFISFALLVFGNLFILCTLNQGENGLPFIFVNLGIMHIVSLSLLPSPKAGRIKIAFRYVLSTLFICVALLDAAQFNNKVNQTRMVLEMYLSPQLMHKSGQMPAGLEFLDFHLTPEYQYIYSRLALIQAVDYLKKENSNFFLIGDSAILYGLAHRPSLNPCLWFHPGYSMPGLDSKELRYYEKRLLDNIRRCKAKFLVIEGERTWFNVSLESFLPLKLLVNENSQENRIFCQIKILRIDYNKLPK